MWKIINGDCLEAMEGMSADCLITDPPYGCTRNEWDHEIELARFWELAKRAVTPGGVFCLFCQMPFAARLYMSNPKMFRYEWVYVKPTLTGFLDARKKPLRAHELVHVFCDRQPPYNPQMGAGEPYRKSRNGNSTNYGKALRVLSESNGERCPKSILDVRHENAFYTVSPEFRRHPTQKSVRALEYLIKTYTKPGDVVLDPFMGSGSTGVAAINTGRKFVGIEREREWCEVAARRLERARQDNALLLPREKRPACQKELLAE